MLYHILLEQADACVCLCVATTIPSRVHTEGGQVRALKRQEDATFRTDETGSHQKEGSKRTAPHLTPQYSNRKCNSPKGNFT